MSVQYVNTLNYYARKIKLQTMLLNVCSVIMVTPAGRAEEPLQKKRRKGLNKILVVLGKMCSLSPSLFDCFCSFPFITLKQLQIKQCL